MSLLVMVSLLTYGYNGQRVMTNIDDIIQNPSFVGEVTRRGTSISGTGLGRTNDTIYLLHIVGEYRKGSDYVQVDNVFIVSAELFHQLEIGDAISHRVLSVCM